MKKIVSYSDKISVVQGDKIRFMVSCDGPTSFRADLVRIIHGDQNPDGPGYKEQCIDSPGGQEYPGRKQEIYSGSCIVIPNNPVMSSLSSFTVQAMIWPTTPEKGRQSLIGNWSEKSNTGFSLVIDDNGALALVLGDGGDNSETISTGKALVAREWYLAAASYDAETGQVCIYQEPLIEHAKIDDNALVQTKSKMPSSGIAHGDTPLIMAAHYRDTVKDRVVCAGHYNGKIDSPRLVNRALNRAEIEILKQGPVPTGLQAATVGAWDFSRELTTESIIDKSANALHGETINLPARAMKGHNWTGEEMNWRHAPEQYGAIHFHDDDLYDAGWDVDFEWVIPDDLKSGIYAARLQSGDDLDYLPFCVRAKRGHADVVFLMPTASYMAYANEHMATDAPLAQLLTGQVVHLQPEDLFVNEHREYGASNYDTHSDGSGVCYSSRLRPILNMRPMYSMWLGGAGSKLWQFNADTHITDWLEAMGHDYDVVTDEDLHYEGVDVLAPYKVVVTGSHPEYGSKSMRDGLEAYKQRGGRLMYLGANGWYWRVAYKPGVIEVRRAEDGVRAWAAEPGEYYHSFTGEYGGLWRRQGLPPQMMCGTGFSAQGFDISSYYRRNSDSFDPRAQFIFEGVGKNELIGDFGLIGGGAAGLELDRADRLLGTPPNALVLASSENHTDIYLVVCEEILINTPAISGSQNELVRADMVFYELPSGGAVFSTSSIAWCGSLSHNNYDNNVSRITDNVVKRFKDATPL